MFARTVLTPIMLLLVLAGGQSSAQQGAEQKTGRIEGRVLEVPSVADRPKLTVRSIELFEKDSGRPSSKAEVDSEGHFVFEDVPAGRVRLQPLFRVGESDYDVSCSSALLLPAILRSEEPLQITLFGKGRPIVGKVVLPPGVKLERVRIWLGLPAPPARTLRGATLDLYSVLKANALESPVDAEGRFRIEGVREGNYWIHATNLDDSSKPLFFNGVEVAGYPHVEYSKLTVPFMEGGQSDKPHDLGSLKFELRPKSQ